MIGESLSPPIDTGFIEHAALCPFASGPTGFYSIWQIVNLIRAAAFLASAMKSIARILSSRFPRLSPQQIFQP